MINVLEIVNTHGVRGEVKALHYTDGDVFFKKVKKLYTKEGREFTIKGWRFQKGAVLLKLEGVDTMEDAQRLKFTELFAKKEDLPKLKEGEYYFYELIGLNGILPDGTVFGRVTDVIENTAANIIEFTKGDAKKALVPNVDEFVKKVDIPNGTIEIKPIEGLID